MVDLQDREDRNALRNVVLKAEEDQIITKEEVGFVVALIERFRADIETKIRQINILQGEVSQLRNNEAVIINLIDNMTRAAERDIARQETAKKIRDKAPKKE